VVALLGRVPEEVPILKKHYLRLEGFTPTSLNKLVGHWARRARLKRGDRQRVQAAAIDQQVPWAAGKRRVSLIVTLGKGQKRMDPDNVFKSILDALTAASLIVDDSGQWVELGPVEWKRGERQTVIVLEDVP
jgi:Holliday junction resolvase RusA-like endonuclease